MLENAIKQGVQLEKNQTAQKMDVRLVQNGTYRGDSDIECSTCSSNMAPNDEKTACIYCPAGTEYSSSPYDKCSPCTGNTVSTTAGSSCSPCTGNTVPNNSRTECTTCPPVKNQM